MARVGSQRHKEKKSVNISTFYGTGWPEDGRDLLKHVVLLVWLINITSYKAVLTVTSASL